jgi:hypothetical protein
MVAALCALQVPGGRADEAGRRADGQRARRRGGQNPGADGTVACLSPAPNQSTPQNQPPAPRSWRPPTPRPTAASSPASPASSSRCGGLGGRRRWVACGGGTGRPRPAAGLCGRWGRPARHRRPPLPLPSRLRHPLPPAGRRAPAAQVLRLPPLPGALHTGVCVWGGGVFTPGASQQRRGLSLSGRAWEGQPQAMEGAGRRSAPFPPNPQIKLLRVLAKLGAGDKAASDNMATVVGAALKRASGGQTIGNAIIYEAVRWAGIGGLARLGGGPAPHDCAAHAVAALRQSVF